MAGTPLDRPPRRKRREWRPRPGAGLDGSKLYVGAGSNSNITENGIDVEEGRAAIYEVDRQTGAKRIPHDLDEDVRDLARSLAPTPAYEASRHRRKKVEMLFATSSGSSNSAACTCEAPTAPATSSCSPAPPRI